MPSADGFLDEVTALLPSLRALGRSLCGDRGKADDLVQETVIRAWANKKQFQPGSNLKGWLYAILRNCYFSELRRYRREIEDPEGMYAACSSIEPDHDAKLQLQEMSRALQRLPPPRREALLLVHAAGLSQSEAAQICGVAVGTIKSRISRARNQLLDLLGEDVAGANVRSSQRTRPCVVNSRDTQRPSQAHLAAHDSPRNELGIPRCVQASLSREVPRSLGASTERLRGTSKCLDQLAALQGGFSIELRAADGAGE